MQTKSFIISIEPLAQELQAMIIEHQGYRGITLDTRMFRELVYATTTSVINAVLGSINPALTNEGIGASTTSMLQGCADSVIYMVNSYGVGKQMPDSVALDIINRLERSVIGHISNYLPDIDNDDVRVIGFERTLTQDYLITLNYPTYYERQ